MSSASPRQLCLLARGCTSRPAGRPAITADLAEEGLALIDQGAEQGGGRRFAALIALGESYRMLGRLTESRAMLDAASRLPKGAMAELVLRCCLGHLCRDMGDYEESLHHFQWVLDSSVFRHNAHDECGNGIALSYCEMGKLDLGFEHAEAALQRARVNGFGKFEAEANIALGSLCLAAGRPGTALAHYKQARDLVRPLRARPTAIAAMIGMATAGTDPDLAREAVTLARADGLRLLEARARTALAQVRLAQGDHDEARTSAESALAMYIGFGSRPGQERARAVLDACR